MSGQIITVDGIGEVLFCKKRQTSRISIKMSPFHPVRIVFPAKISEAEAMKYLLLKKDWILRTSLKIRKIEETAFKSQQTVLNEQNKHIEYINALDNKLKVQLIDDKIRVCIPLNLARNHPNVVIAVKAGILKKLFSQAKKILPLKVESLAREFDFTYNKVFIKNMRTLWGSCSYANNINLSMYLLHLPEHLVNYVILHELVHTVQKSHRKEFWDKLETICPRSLEYAKEIKQYRFLLLN